MHKEWVLRIREQCAVAKVPFFFKQWGGVRKSEAGRLLDGRTYDEMPCRTEQKEVTQRIRLQVIDEVKSWKDLQVA
jgi:hypothetical protein